MNPFVLRIQAIRFFCLPSDASKEGLLLFFSFAVTIHQFSCHTHQITSSRTNKLDRGQDSFVIPWRMSQFKCKLYGKHFNSEMNHKAILRLETLIGSNNRLLRWLLAIQSFKAAGEASVL